MEEERAIKAALKVEASEIGLPADLLERILRQEPGVRRVRPGRWSWLGPKLEVLAACVVLAALVGLSAMRSLGPGQADRDRPAGAVPPPLVGERVKSVEPARDAEAVIFGFFAAALSGDRDAARSYWVSQSDPAEIDAWVDAWHSSREQIRLVVDTPTYSADSASVPVNILPRPADRPPANRTEGRLGIVPEADFYFRLRLVDGVWQIAEILPALAR